MGKPVSPFNPSASQFEGRSAKPETNLNDPNVFPLLGGFEPLDLGFFDISNLFDSGYARLGA